jgi:dienelactone hydrolase
MRSGSFLASAIIAMAALQLTGCAVLTHGKQYGKCPLPDESGFERRDFHASASGHTYPLYVTREGQAPFLMLHPLGGLDPCTLEVCKELEDRGWKVYAPILDGGTYGERNIPRSYVHIRNDPAWKVTDPHACGDVLDDMRELAQSISKTHGGRRVVVMGNCMTGGIPLGMLDLPSVGTAVVCQPALPLKTLKGDPIKNAETWGIPQHLENAALTALRRDPTKRILGFHFYEDPTAPYRKFEALHDRLGPELQDRFRPVVVLRGSSKMTPPEWWDAPVLRTSVRPSLSEPHSTVCGAMEPRDRSQLRRRFFELLGEAAR